MQETLQFKVYTRVTSVRKYIPEILTIDFKQNSSFRNLYIPVGALLTVTGTGIRTFFHVSPLTLNTSLF